MDVPSETDLCLISAALRIEALESEVRKYRRLAYTDDLTGLPNGRFLREYVARDPDGAWVMVDLNGFGAYQNANGGHPEGDRVLQDFASWLSRNTRGSDLVAARVGGDEFAVYVQGDNPIRGASRIACEIITEWQYVTVTASAGIGWTQKEADKMLYVVKYGLEIAEK